MCIIERLFSSSLVAVVELAHPRKLRACHFKVVHVYRYIHCRTVCMYVHIHVVVSACTCTCSCECRVLYRRYDVGRDVTVSYVYKCVFNRK